MILQRSSLFSSATQARSLCHLSIAHRSRSIECVSCLATLSKNHCFGVFLYLTRSRSTVSTYPTRNPYQFFGRRFPIFFLYNHSERSSKDALHFFYGLFLERILSCEKKPTKEMIQAAESIRIRYNIPMDVHWGMLSKFDEGVTQYMKHLQRFGVYTVPSLAVLLLPRTKRSPRCTARRTSPSVASQIVPHF